MSSKTKIVVLHMKELVYTGIFVALGILFIILLVIMFLPENEDSGQPSYDPAATQPDDTSSPGQTDGTAITTSSNGLYIPGIYTTQLILPDQTIDIEVIVDNENITSLRLINLSDDISTIYPLLEPAFEALSQQIYEKQSVDNITYETDKKYTTLVLLEAIRNALDRAYISSYTITE